ncbi:hypothetical protein [Bradyrhizobium australafricanum]|uniref:hypothetical protein n=1 Tax=Bradyrhizobium australafricanum TaxID=2821406 RepID=UPI001CE3A09B|nr:hypothetical protein [Bradyrhizobium australafricanum]MCA6105401.1 hypothetical protein [Bradyrhizobium australafricanum]
MTEGFVWAGFMFISAAVAAAGCVAVWAMIVLTLGIAGKVMVLIGLAATQVIIVRRVRTMAASRDAADFDGVRVPDRRD